MNSKIIFFDVETAPLPQAELEAMMPPFDPEAVKTGNMKDPEKIAAKIEEARVSHRQNFLDRAALDPMTARVLAIGLTYWPEPETEIIGYTYEKETLQAFWNRCRGDAGRVHQLVGFNISTFDLPFLFKRSWKHGVDIPWGYRRGRYWSHQVVDLREEWQLGDRMAPGSLDSVAKFLGVGAKNGDGAAFAKLWETDRKTATQYLINDVALCARIAEALDLFKIPADQ